jgi:3-oxoadipate enol-lactonase
LKLDVAGVGIAYRSDGSPDGPPTVLLHSAGCDLRMWDPHVPTLGERFRLVRVDARGHGGSDAPPPPYSMERFGDDVIAVLDEMHAALDRNGVLSPRLQHGFSATTWIALADSVERGIDTRVGLEDTLQNPDGAQASGNEELVRAARAGYGAGAE